MKSNGYMWIVPPIPARGTPEVRGICIERCQVKAIFEEDGVSIVDRECCIGFGLCVTGCPNEVARLEKSWIPK